MSSGLFFFFICACLVLAWIRQPLMQYLKQQPKQAEQNGKPTVLPEYAAFKQNTIEEPENPVHWAKWGTALLAEARASSASGAIKRLRYHEACSCFSQALEITDSYTPAWIGWGTALYGLFQIQKDKDPFFLEGGHSKFRAAIALQVQSLEVWQAWRQELSELAANAPAEYRAGLKLLEEECATKITDGTVLPSLDPVQTGSDLPPLSGANKSPGETRGENPQELGGKDLDTTENNTPT